MSLLSEASSDECAASILGGHFRCQSVATAATKTAAAAATTATTTSAPTSIDFRTTTPSAPATVGAADADVDVALAAPAASAAAAAGDSSPGVDFLHALDGLRPAPLDRNLLQETRMRQVHSLLKPRFPP